MRFQTKTKRAGRKSERLSILFMRFEEKMEVENVIENEAFNSLYEIQNERI